MPIHPMMLTLSLVIAAPAPATATPQPPADAPAAPAPADDERAVHYRFREDHDLPPNESLRENPKPYRVAFRETISIETEGLEKREATQEARYVERPSQVDPRDTVLAVVRRYDFYELAPAPPSKFPEHEPFADLRLWVAPEPDAEWLVINLDPRRLMRVEEHRRLARQVFVPHLFRLMNPLPVRVGDSWTLNGRQIAVLQGGRFSAVAEAEATLDEIRDAPPERPGRKLAVVSIRARGKPNDANSFLMNTRVEFEFVPAPPNPADPESARNPNAPPVLNARGHVVKLALAEALSETGNDGRTRSVKRSLLLERRYDREAAEIELPVPIPPPLANPRNSWLLYADPDGRFHFLQPPEFNAIPNPAGGVDLARETPLGPDVLSLNPFPLEKLDPVLQRRGRIDAWRAEGREPRVGQLLDLPPDEWPQRRVQRFSALLPLDENDPRDRDRDRDRAPAPRTKPAGDPKIIRFDGYVVLYPADNSLYAESMTLAPDHEEYRRLVELVLQTFRFGPPPPPKPRSD